MILPLFVLGINLVVGSLNCPLGSHYTDELRVEGEPVVMKCPLGPFGSFDQKYLEMKWDRTNGTLQEPRVKEDVEGYLWFLPAWKNDSGSYICTVKNGTGCWSTKVELKVFSQNEDEKIEYRQQVTDNSSGMLVCPDLSYFTNNNSRKIDNVTWYRHSSPLNLTTGSRFQKIPGTNNVLLSVAIPEDEGKYRCVLTFIYHNTTYHVTRNIHLKVKKLMVENVPTILFPSRNISVNVGSTMTVPCTVFLGNGVSFTTQVWWTANNTPIEDFYHDERITEGPYQEYFDNGSYIEVSLIFNPVLREDSKTNFKCTAKNTKGRDTLEIGLRIDEETTSYLLGILLSVIPLLVLVFLWGGTWLYRRYRDRKNKDRDVLLMETEKLDD